MRLEPQLFGGQDTDETNKHSRHDNQKTARNTWCDINSEIQPNGKTALKVRHLVEAMDEEEMSFHEQTTQNLVIETGLEGEKVWKNYNDTTLRQNALREIELNKPALVVYTGGSIMSEERSVGLYCEAKGFVGRYKIEKDVPISSAEQKAIEIATNFIFQQDEQRAVILTDSRTACQILMKAMKRDRHKKIAIRILKVIQQNTQKQINNKMDSSTRRRNKKTDILAKDGSRNGTPIDYSLQLKDAYRILKQTQREE
jgi:hypothetical protein